MSQAASDLIHLMIESDVTPQDLRHYVRDVAEAAATDALRTLPDTVHFLLDHDEPSASVEVAILYAIGRKRPLTDLERARRDHLDRVLGG